MLERLNEPADSLAVDGPGSEQLAQMRIGINEPNPDTHADQGKRQHDDCVPNEARQTLLGNFIPLLRRFVRIHTAILNADEKAAPA